MDIEPGNVTTLQIENLAQAIDDDWALEVEKQIYKHDQEIELIKSLRDQIKQLKDENTRLIHSNEELSAEYLLIKNHFRYAHHLGFEEIKTLFEERPAAAKRKRVVKNKNKD